MRLSSSNMFIGTEVLWRSVVDFMASRSKAL